MAAVLTLAAYAGLRAAEIAQLCWSDLDVDHGLLLVTDGKGGKQRTVPLHPAILAALQQLGQQRRGPVLVRRDGRSGHWTHSVVSKYANTYLHALGFSDTLHSLRHRYGTAVYFASHDLRLTQELMGHASPVTTAGYTAWDRSAASAIVNKLP